MTATIVFSIVRLAANTAPEVMASFDDQDAAERLCDALNRLAADSITHYVVQED